MDNVYHFSNLGPIALILCLVILDFFLDCLHQDAGIEKQFFLSLSSGQIQGTMTQCLQLTKTDANGKPISFKLLIQLHKGSQNVPALVLILPAHLR